jgi:FtsZ-binding cell division protein ZapB
MTANELADKCGLIIEDYDFGIQVAIMLRKQEAELNEAGHMICMLRWEIGELKEKLELAEWDEDVWKKFKRDNYEVINLTPRSKK